MREQPTLAINAAAISRQRTIGANHAMAWNNDGDRIRAVR
jgi:hypothetical protein